MRKPTGAAQVIALIIAAAQAAEDAATIGGNRQEGDDQ